MSRLLLNEGLVKTPGRSPGLKCNIDIYVTKVVSVSVTLSHFHSYISFSGTSEASRLAQDSKDKPTSLVVRESCPPPTTDSQQQALTSPSQTSKPIEQPKVDPVLPTVEPQGNLQRFVKQVV